MIIAGVTGGIGSGKTTVCKTWEKLGATVVYADDLAKEIMIKNKPLKKKLVKLFGEETYLQDGTLNKPHLIKEAFEKGRVEELNDAVHPAVAKEFALICEYERKSGTDLVVKEAAILLNKGRPRGIDKVVLVLSKPQNRIERVKKRDKTSAEDVAARMDKQPEFENLTHLADFVIYNNGSIAELQKKAREVYTKLLDS